MGNNLPSPTMVMRSPSDTETSPSPSAWCDATTRAVLRLPGWPDPAPGPLVGFSCGLKARIGGLFSAADGLIHAGVGLFPAGAGLFPPGVGLLFVCPGPGLVGKDGLS